ncbi:hypothetical protein [Cyanobium sp. ATX 6F1]|uniref:hypothetical protein n=1 Tax=unclassified Cyanobium TaxID=2627006 RepID=UPI0020CC49B6|nr:hypothetical protein [Cyanobium sp. ATX 6F1]MCP9917226.1 hypothetical protein [Cyanobium sp. ATX 6F1]
MTSSNSSPGRLTRRRSSAGPLPPNRPQRPREAFPGSSRGNFRPTFLTLRDHGKVYVAHLPRLSDGQLAKVVEEAQEVLESLNRRLQELECQLSLTSVDRETQIRASTKRDVTERFIRAVEEEQEHRRSNPGLPSAAGESVSSAFLEIARQRLPIVIFDSLLQEALAACDNPEPTASLALSGPLGPESGHGAPLLRQSPEPPVRRETMPVVLTPDPSGQAL